MSRAVNQAGSVAHEPGPFRTGSRIISVVAFTSFGDRDLCRHQHVKEPSSDNSASRDH